VLLWRRDEHRKLVTSLDVMCEYNERFGLENPNDWIFRLLTIGYHIPLANARFYGTYKNCIYGFNILWSTDGWAKMSYPDLHYRPKFDLMNNGRYANIHQYFVVLIKSIVAPISSWLRKTSEFYWNLFNENFHVLPIHCFVFFVYLS